MDLSLTTVQMNEGQRTDQFRELLQQEMSVLEQYATPMANGHGEYVRFPLVGKTEMEHRTQRYEQISADELDYGWRGVRPELFQKTLRRSTDDPLFQNGLGLGTSTDTAALSKAAARVKDPVLMGSYKDESTGSATKGYYRIKGVNSLSSAAVDGSPYKGGTTGGLLGDNYVGKQCTEKEAFPLFPLLMGGQASAYGDYTGEASTPVNMEKTNIIPVNYALKGTGADSNLTIDKVFAVIRAMEERYGAGQICMAITAKQKWNLISEDERLQNKNYGFQALRDGPIVDVLGVRFVTSNVIPVVNIGTEGSPKWVRINPAWRKEDLLYSVWDDMKITIRTPQMNNTIDEITTTATMGLGAGRARLETVIGVLCNDCPELNS